MEFELLGWPDDGVTLELDHREFSYAGKFVMSNTGKAVVRDEVRPVAAASFSADRTDPDRVWIRYLTVRVDRQREGVGATFATALRLHLLDHGFDLVSIAVNNPFAFEACYRAGFSWEGDETGLAELVLRYPGERDPESYRTGMTRYETVRTLSDDEQAFVNERRDEQPPEPVDIPPSWRPS